MAFTHGDLIGWAVCWAAQPAKLAERRAQWPDVLTWRWLLDPDRVRVFDRPEQLAIASTAVGYAHRRRVQLWQRPGAIWAECKRLAELGDDGARWEIYRRLGDALDAFDESAEQYAGGMLEP